MPTPNLNIATEIDSLDLALTDTVDQDLTSGDVTVTDTDFRENIVLRAINNTVARNLTVPAIKRLFVVRNDGTATLTVALGTTSLLVEAGEATIFYTDGTANGLKEISSSDRAVTYAELPFSGVHARRDTSTSIAASTATILPFETNRWQTKYNGYSFWLGADLSFTGLSIADDTVTASGHGLITGDGPLQLIEDNTLPAPLTEVTNYWVIVVDANTIKFATSFADAIANSPVNLTTLGTSTNTLDRASQLVIPDGITKVLIAGEGLWAGNSNTFRQLSFKKNDVFQDFNQYSHGLTASLTAITSSYVLDVVGGDRIAVSHYTGTTVNLLRTALVLTVLK